MNFVPKMNRRSFLVGTVAVGGGLSLGLDLPLGPSVARAADGSPEINAWVVIRPDDTVVIRIARSEMGQGTLTGLAQLVAEELQCDWSKVTTEYPSPGQSVARKRAWGDFSTGGSRGIRESQEYVRKGGATARMMLIQAAANEWSVAASECTAANSVITHKASGRTTTYGKVAEAAAKLEPPKDIVLKDPKDWTIAGKPLKRLDTADKLTGKMEYGIDVKLPGMLCAAIKDCPVFGGKVKSFDAAKVTGMKGVRHVLAVGDTAARRPANRVGRGTERCRLQRHNRGAIEGRPHRGAGLCRQRKRRRQGGHQGRRQSGRGGLRLSVPEPRHHGADERDRALHSGQVRGVDRNAER
jgi:isoquinoline 1-oxidoreductase beta subunit